MAPRLGRNFPVPVLYSLVMHRAAHLVISCLILVPLLHSTIARGQQNPQPRVEHFVTLDQPQTQFISVTQCIVGLQGQYVDFRLPIWRPGRYVVMNQAQSIREFNAFGDEGRPLKSEKIDKSTWRVALEGSTTARIAYRVYCNSLADRTRHVDDTHAFLDGATIFMYTNETRGLPCWLTINKPADWRIACGLNPLSKGGDTLVAPNYDALVDSPLEIGVHDVIDFEAAGKPHQVVIWGDADAKPEDIKRDFSRIIEEQSKIFGSTPYERYLFIIHAGVGGGGGTEHVNSTVMQTARASLEDAAAFQRFLSLVSHEFFHTWNIKSFRPAGLNPYDYQRENYTDLLWVAEGTTSYYSPLVLVRAGLTPSARYIDTLADSIDAMRNRPSETVQSVAEASFDSWIHYGVRTPDDINATVDFYGKGSLVSLLIDLEMRKRSGGKASLDDVMRALYERYPLAAGKGYTTADLQSIIEELTGADFDDVFNRHVRDAQPLNFEDAFEAVGLDLYFRDGDASDAGSRRGGRTVRTGGVRDTASEDRDSAMEEGASTSEPQSQPESQPDTQRRMKAYLGLNLSDGGSIAAPAGSASSAATLPPAPSGKTTVTSVLSDGPAFAEGVLPGDEILALDGRRLTAANLDARLRTLKPGQRITLTTFRRDELRTTVITLTAKPDGRWSLRKVANPTDSQKASYESWLGQKW